MPHAYTEDQLGWATVSALEETFGAAGTLQRETKGEVVLVSRLRAAPARSNAGRMGHPASPPEGITAGDSIERQAAGFRKHLITSSFFE